MRRVFQIILLTLVIGLPCSTTQAATIEYIAHACFVIESDDGERVLVDPFASQVWLGYDFPALPAVDAVVVTHPHYDHDAGRYRGEPWPWDEAVPVFDAPGESSIGSFEIRGVQGKHADPYGKEFGQLNTIFRIEVDGCRSSHLGDNGPLTEENYRELRTGGRPDGAGRRAGAHPEERRDRGHRRRARAARGHPDALSNSTVGVRS